MLSRFLTAIVFVAAAAIGGVGFAPAEPNSLGELTKSFQSPPDAARPWVYWFWLNGNITREGITADLEAMKRAGIGGMIIMEVDQGTPKGPVAFGSPEWRELFKFACGEADRLGLEITMNNDAGWCGSGGPWITPEMSVQKLVWTETHVEGPKRIEQALPKAPVVAEFYRDIRVVAFPTPAGNARIDSLAAKSSQDTTDFHYGGRSNLLPTHAQWRVVPAAETVARGKVVDVTDKMDGQGRLAWDAPAGKWTILRVGHTPTGKANHPAPEAGCGLEIDKMSTKALDIHFANLIGKLTADVGPLAGKSFVATHIDSWETGNISWTENFREEFKRRRGYDLMPFFPVTAGWIVENREVSERFLWDLRQTINEMVLQNYVEHMRDLAHKAGIRLSIEGYSTCPMDELAYGGRADEPIGEFWTWWFATDKPYGFAFTCTEMASAGHVYGKRIVGAEAFTATDSEKWQNHPGNIKELGDWAFCEGINRFVFHRYAMQPWSNVKPGISMGPWGLHYERTQTWWEMTPAWHTYLARCQHLLRQGLFVADVCYLGAEGSPQSIGSQKRFLAKDSDNLDEPRDRTGYNFDLCSPDALLTRVSVKDGLVVLPDGMSYRLLALPMIETMSPQLLRKVKELVEAGATVVGPRPVKSPSLHEYPKCDDEVQTLAAEIWGSGYAPKELAERKVGQGRVFWSAAIQEHAAQQGRSPREVFGAATWIWHPDGDPAVAVPPGNRYFRRTFKINAAKSVVSATLTLHADNACTAWCNGRKVGQVHQFNRIVHVDVKRWLRDGENLLAVDAFNGAGQPNPAGLIGKLAIKFADGRTQEIVTDAQWQSAEKAEGSWNTSLEPIQGWSAARVAGPMGMAPWGEIAPTAAEPELFAEEEIIAAVMEKIGTPPDFSYQTKSGAPSLRYIHRKLPDADVYFVANRLGQKEQATCRFRANGRRPEFWYPESGRIEQPAVYGLRHDLVQVPITLEQSGSVFVVFREAAAEPNERIVSVARDGKVVLSASTDENAPPLAENCDKPAKVEDPGIRLNRDEAGRLAVDVAKPGTYTLRFNDGRTQTVAVASVPGPIDVAGPWTLRFAPGGGAPEAVTLDKLISWSEHPDKGVKYFSGTATYTNQFTLPADALTKGRRHVLDLGDVEVMADVKVNGKSLGVLWKTPYRVDITDALKAGENILEIEVANLWINRMIGDEFLPDDSNRHHNGTLKEWPKWILEGKSSPTGRYTFTTWRLWSKNDALRPSGLLGPVRILTTQSATPD